jgi:DNA polymerase-4/DNA polymerase V
MAKMANQAAKQNPSGVEWWKSTDVAAKLHPLPVDRMWGLKRRAEVLQRDFGAETIGDVARIPEAELMKRFGVWGTIIHRWSHGQDLSPVDPRAHDAPQKGFSQRITLPHDFCERSDIAVVVLELLDELCLRVRLSHHKGRRVGLGLTYADFEGGFYRTRTIPEATDDANDLYPHVLALLDRHWKGEPVRAVSVSLDLLEVNDGTVQMSLFENRAKKRQLTATLDRIRLRYGQTALMRAVSLLPAGQIRDRSRKIGGHYR